MGWIISLVVVLKRLCMSAFLIGYLLVVLKASIVNKTGSLLYHLLVTLKQSFAELQINCVSGLSALLTNVGNLNHYVVSEVITGL